MTSTIDSLIEFYGEPISIYTRAQALADGALVEPDQQLVKEAGICWPLAMTAAVHADLVAWSPEDEKRKGCTGQDETGRLWDVLNMTRFALTARGRRTRGQALEGGERVPVTLYRVPRQGRGLTARRVTVHAHIGGDDTGAPCITLMQVDED